MIFNSQESESTGQRKILCHCDGKRRMLGVQVFPGMRRKNPLAARQVFSAPLIIVGLLGISVLTSVIAKRRGPPHDAPPSGLA